MNKISNQNNISSSPITSLSSSINNTYFKENILEEKINNNNNLNNENEIEG